MLFLIIILGVALAQESQSPSGDGNCCARINTIYSAYPTQPGVATCSFKRDGGDLSYYTDGQTCAGYENAQTLEDGVTYQIRDVFFDLLEANYTKVPFNEYYFEQFLKHVGLRVGNLWLSFTQSATSMKLTYNPSLGQISICGTAYGTIISGACHASSDGATLCSDGICTDFMDSVLYHVELNVSTDAIFNGDAVAQPTNTNGGDWAAYVSESGVPVNGSLTNKGRFYIIDHPEISVDFALIDLSTDNFVILPEPWRREPMSQMFIVSNNGTGLGYTGFVGVAGIRTYGLPAPLAYVYEFSTSTPRMVIMSSIVNGMTITVPPLYAAVPSGTAGNGLFMFIVEAACGVDTASCPVISPFGQTETESTGVKSPASTSAQDGVNLFPLYVSLIALSVAILLMALMAFCVNERNNKQRYLI